MMRKSTTTFLFLITRKIVFESIKGYDSIHILRLEASSEKSLFSLSCEGRTGNGNCHASVGERMLIASYRHSILHD